MGTETVAGKRVFVYARVSTTRQEKNDLSLPDQIATAERWFEDNGAQAVPRLSEAGSATDDHRRAFREMIALARIGRASRRHHPRAFAVAAVP